MKPHSPRFNTRCQGRRGPVWPRRGWGLLMLLWALGVQAAPAAVPPGNPATDQTIRRLLADFPVSYTVSHNGFHLGVAQRTLRRTGPDTLEFESVAKPTGLAALFISDHVIEHSEITLIDHQLHPLRYSYRKTGGKHERHYNLQFDWQQKVITSSYRHTTTALPCNVQDLLSFQLALMLDLQQGKHTFTYAIADKKQVREYHFQVSGGKQLDTAIGRIQTVRLIHANQDGEGRFVFWLAKQHNYLPVLIQHYDQDGNMTTMALHSLRGRITSLPDEGSQD